MTSPTSPPIGFLVSDDLIFASRITGTARDLGLQMLTFRSAQALREAGQSPRCVVLDLANPGLDLGGLVAHLKKQSPPPLIVAYGSHVDTATLQAARDAGCDVVWPRSKFVQELAGALPGWFSSRDAE